MTVKGYYSTPSTLSSLFLSIPYLIDLQKAERLVWPSKIANTKQALLLQSTLQTFLVIFRYTNQSIGIVGPLVQVGILKR